MLTLRFDQRTNRGLSHGNWEERTVLLAPSIGAAPAPQAYPLGTHITGDASAASRVDYVDSLFEFSNPLGTDYSGECSSAAFERGTFTKALPCLLPLN